MRVNETLSQHTQHSSRHSIATIESGGHSVWFDAEEGAEEFVLTAEPSEQASSANTSEGGSDGEASDDSEDEIDEALQATPQLTPTKLEAAPQQHRVIIRRTRLPSPMTGDDGSLLAVLRKNVGKVGPIVVVLLPRCTHAS